MNCAVFYSIDFFHPQICNSSCSYYAIFRRLTLRWFANITINASIFREDFEGVRKISSTQIQKEILCPALSDPMIKKWCAEIFHEASGQICFQIGLYQRKIQKKKKIKQRNLSPIGLMASIYLNLSFVFFSSKPISFFYKNIQIAYCIEVNLGEKRAFSKQWFDIYDPLVSLMKFSLFRTVFLTELRTKETNN